MFVSRFMPCDHCGESLDCAVPAPHECSPDRVADFRMFALREEVDQLEQRFEAYLHSAHGRFEVWLAARHVRRSR